MPLRRPYLGGAAQHATQACAWIGVSRDSANSARTISLWSWYGAQGLPTNSPLIAAYEKAYPGVKVMIRAFGSTTDYSPALAAAIAGGDAPDIFAPSFGAVSYGLEGVALDVRAALGDIPEPVLYQWQRAVLLQR